MKRTVMFLIVVFFIFQIPAYAQSQSQRGMQGGAMERSQSGEMMRQQTMPRDMMRDRRI